MKRNDFNFFNFIKLVPKPRKHQKLVYFLKCWTIQNIYNINVIKGWVFNVVYLSRSKERTNRAQLCELSKPIINQSICAVKSVRLCSKYIQKLHGSVVLHSSIHHSSYLWVNLSIRPSITNLPKHPSLVVNMLKTAEKK